MLTNVSEVRTASIIRAKNIAVRTSETSVSIYLTTRQYIPEESKLYTVLLYQSPLLFLTHNVSGCTFVFRWQMGRQIRQGLNSTLVAILFGR
jgi:hypothetical protein